VVPATGYFNPVTGRFFNTISDGPVVDSAKQGQYTSYNGTVYFNRLAPAGSQVKSSFIEGVSADYNNANINWAAAGVTGPTDPNASFASLTPLQKLVVANSLGYLYDYDRIDYLDWSSAVFDYSTVTKAEWIEASSLNFAVVISAAQWGTVTKPLTGTPYSGLTTAQQAVVDKYVKFVPTQTDLFTLSGSFAAGDVLAFTLNGKTLSYTVQSSDLGVTASATLDNVAKGMAKTVNDLQSAALFSATSVAVPAVSSVTVSASSGSTVQIDTGTETRLQVSGTNSATILTLRGSFQQGDAVLFKVNGKQVHYTVSSADVGADAEATRTNLATRLAQAINDRLSAPVFRANDVVVPASASVTISAATPQGVVKLDVGTDTRLQVTGTSTARVLTLSGSFLAAQTLSLNVNGVVVQYIVTANDVGTSNEATHANLAVKLAGAIGTAIASATAAVTVTSTTTVTGSFAVNVSANTAVAAVNIDTGNDTRLVLSGTASAKVLTLSGSFVAGNVLSLTVNGTAVSYTVTSADVGATDATTQGNVATQLANAIGLTMTTAARAFTTTSASTAEFVKLNLQPETAGTTLTISNADARLLVTDSTGGKQIALTGAFAVNETLSVTVNATAVSYTVLSADIGATEVATRNHLAQALVNAINAAAPRLTAQATAVHASTTEISTVTVQPGTTGTTLSLVSTDARLVVSGQQITVLGTFVKDQALSVTVNGTLATYTVTTADFGETDDVVRNRVAIGLADAIAAAAPRAVPVVTVSSTTTASVSSVRVTSTATPAAAVTLSATDRVHFVVSDIQSGKALVLQGTFMAGDVLSVMVNSAEVSYTVLAADIGIADDVTRANVAGKLATAILAKGLSGVGIAAQTTAPVTQLRVSQVADAPAFTLSFTDTAHLSVQHNLFDELSFDQQMLVTSKLRPALSVQYKDLTAGQKTVVAKALTNATTPIQFFNYNALPGKKLVTDFSQGVLTDYTNANMLWGSAGAATGSTTFASLTQAQKDVVAHSLGYDRYDGQHYFKADAPLSEMWVSGFTAGGGAFDLSTIDWGGVAMPDATVGFEQLTIAQRAVVLKDQGYDIVNRQVYRKADGTIKDAFVDGSGKDYDSAAKDWWGTVAPAAPGTLWTDLTLPQQDYVLTKLSYTRWDGLVFHKAGAATPYKLTFVQGTGAGSDYANSSIIWNTLRDITKPADTGIPVAGTALKDLSSEQKALVLEQAGLVEYTGTVYYNADAGAGKQLVTSFIVDYSKADAPATPTKRWLLSDGTGPDAHKYLVYAYDATNDGITDKIQIMEPHVLTGQRGAGFLLTGTVTTLQDNADFVVDVKDDAIVSGGYIYLLGAGSDLSIASDRSVFWQGEGSINGNITLTGRGAQGVGMPLDGVSVYVHASSTLSSIQAGSHITISGRDDVEIQGAVLAGAVRDTDGTRYLGPDSTVSITAGQQILLNNSLAAAKSVTLKTTAGPGSDDNHIAVRLDTVAGMTAAGWTSDNSGGLVDIDAKGGVVLGGMVLSGGRAVQSFNGAGRLTGETITWTDELSTVRIKASGQLDLGIDTLGLSGNMVTVGARIRASQLIEVSGGANSDHVGVRLPESAVLAVANPDGVLKINAAQDAWLMGQMLSGGEVLDHYDTAGYYLGSTVRNFGGNSEIRIQADEQIRLGRDLMAGKLIDVRGGTSTHLATVADPWADEGIVIGGNVNIRTWQDYSSISLSAGGDMSVLTPAWTQEIVADGFVEFADGHLSAAATFNLTIEQGTVDATHDITLAAARSVNNPGLGGLGKVVYDLQAAIDTAFGFVAAADRKVTVRLDDGRLLLSSNYELRLAKVTSGAAERLGFSQIKESSPTKGLTTSERGYAIDASGRGSVVNLGRANAAAGAISIAGAIRGYSAVNMYAGTNSLGAQSVSFLATSLLETLDGSMVMNPAGATTLEGDFIARGANASIVINATGTLALKGNLTAQRDILINAGKREQAGEVSIHTYGTSNLKTLDAGGRIVVTGFNDVVIDSVIGKGNPKLGLLQVASTTGNVSILATSAWLETGSNLVLSGKTVDVAGVLRSHQASAATYDNELTISATQDVHLHGAIGIVGSMLVTAGGDVDVGNMALSAQSSGHSLKMVAGDAITLGGTTAGSAVIAEANALLSLKAGGLITLYENAQLYSTGNQSVIKLEAQSISAMGAVRAGADHPFAYDPTKESMAFDGSAAVTYTGKSATIDIKTVNELTLGNNTSGWGGQLFATGAINVQTGSTLGGTGFDMTAASQVKVDATGYGTWADTLVDASNWKIVAGIAYGISLGSSNFSSTATANSTLNTVLDDLRSQINANASFAANRAGDVLTLTQKDGKLLASTSAVTATTSTAPAVGTAAVVQGNSSTPATVNTTGWSVVTGGRYSITLGTGTAAQIYTVTAGKDYTLTMVTEELARLVKEGALFTAAISGNVLTLQNAADKSTYTGTLAAAADSSAGTAAVTAGNSDLLADGQLSIVSDGDILLRGAVSTVDVGSDMLLRSRSMINIGGLVTAQESITVRAGIDTSKIGVWVQELFVEKQLDKSLKYISGGALDTASGGSIDIESVDGITITGVLGQRQTSDGDLGGAKVSSIRIESLSGDVNLLRNTNVRDTLTVVGNSVGVLSGSYVYATGAESSLYLKARNALVLSGSAIAAGLEPAIAKAANLVHMVAPTMTINGTIEVTSLTGRALLSAGSSVSIGGTIVSKGNIDVHAGVSMTWSADQMRGTTTPVTRANLNGGTITIAGQGLLQAVGKVSLLAGGNVTLNADANVAAVETVLVPVYVTAEKEVKVVVDTVKVSDGTVLVPEVTWVPTQITEQVGTDLVVVGSRYETMTVDLQQIGYFNPNAPDARKFVEVLIEGVHYLNDNSRDSAPAYAHVMTGTDWDNAGNEQVPTRSVPASDRPTGDYTAASYRAFTQLSDAQKWAVFNATGYMPLYDFGYSNWKLNQTINGTASALAEGFVGTDGKTLHPTWNPTGSLAATTKDVFYVDVANWRDKYILMPVGAQEAILSVATSGEAKYLTGDDVGTEADGNNDGGSWVTLDNVGASLVLRQALFDNAVTTSVATVLTGSALSTALTSLESKGVSVSSLGLGEKVGKYQDYANVLYSQKDSAFTSSTLIGAVDTDGKAASWQTSYASGGQRTYQLTNGLSAIFTPMPTNSPDFTLNQKPEWATGPQVLQYGTDARNTAAASGADGNIDWVNWGSMSQTNGGTSTVSGTAGGVTVSFAGEALGMNWGNKGWNYSGYSGSGVNNGPSGSYISFQEGNRSGKITFSQSVVNPIIAIQSLGNGGDSAVLWFGNEDFDVVTGTINAGWGNGSIWEGSGGYVGNSGEGNGIIRFNGIYKELTWVIADSEYYGNFTVGFDAKAPASDGLRATSTIYAPGAYLGELANNTESVTVNTGTTTTKWDVNVGYAPGFANYWGDSTALYQHINYGGSTYNLDLFSGNRVSGFNDVASALWLGNQTKQVTLYEHVDYAGASKTYTSSDSWLGSSGNIGNDIVSSYKVWGYRYEDFTNYQYKWTSKWNDVYDQRIQLSYNLSTQAQDIYDYRPVYKTSIQMVKVENMKSVNVWRDEPVYATQVQLVTEVKYDTATGRSSLGSADSVTAGNIVIDSGGSVAISGKMSATQLIKVDSVGQFSLQGQVKGTGTSAKPITATLSANAINLYAGSTLLLDDSALLKASQGSTQALATATLHSATTLNVGGRIGTETGISFGTVTLKSDRNVEISGTVDAAAITVLAGQGASKDGRINADSDTRLSASTGNLTLTAGQYGGHIILSSSTLQATAAGARIELSAAAGTVTQVKIAGTDTKGTTTTTDDVTVQVISGLVSADVLKVVAENAITLQTKAATLELLQLKGAGNIEIVNSGNLLLTDAEAFDGAISVSTYGSLQVTAARTLGSSDSNDMVFTATQAPPVAPATTKTPATLTLGILTNTGRGDVVLRAEGAIAQASSSLITADLLDVQASMVGLATPSGQTWLVNLATKVNTLTVNTDGAGDVQILQDKATASASAARALVVKDTVIGKGDLVLDAAGAVELTSVVLAANSSSNKLDVTAGGDIVVRYASAGIYLASAADAPKKDLNNDGDYLDTVAGVNETLSSASSAGNITLRAGGSITEGGADTDVDLIANRLTLTAGTGITGLELAINELYAGSTAGDIIVSDTDGALESSAGMDVLRAATVKSASANTLATTVSLTAQTQLRVGATGLVRGDMLRLTSTTGSVSVVKPTAWSLTTPSLNNSLDHNGGIALVAKDYGQV
jgi:hypothetical protein